MVATAAAIESSANLRAPDMPGSIHGKRLTPRGSLNRRGRQG
jgi:hypothetical protein